MKHPRGEKGTKRRRPNRQSSLPPLTMAAALLMVLVVDRLFYSVSGWFQSQPKNSFSRRRLLERAHIGLRLVNQSAVLEEILDQAALSSNTETVDSSVSLSSTEPPPHWAHPGRQQTESSPTTTLETSTLGDIMSGGQLLTEGGKDAAPQTLAAVYGITHPLDRLALTANGNLQRLVSSYYDAPVSVVVDSCQKRQESSRIWDRRVHLMVYNQTFCTATSEIAVHDPLCQQLVESGQVGLGQLFRFLDLLPTFWLHNAASKESGGFWRDYTLQCLELECRIHEDFVPDMWELRPLN